MSSSNLIRWSGLSFIVAGILIGLYTILDAILFAGVGNSKAMATGSWFIVQVVFMVGLIALALGLVGVYAQFADLAGSLGLISFLLAFAGTMMVFGEVWSESFLGPMIATESPALLDAEPSGVVAAGVIISFVLFALGYFLFGFASSKTQYFPRGAAILLMVGAVLAFVLFILEAPFALILLGAGVAWMGYSLWSGEQRTLTTKAAT